MIVNRCTWRGGRVVEGADLESLLCGNVYEGSNPSLSVLTVISKQLSVIKDNCLEVAYAGLLQP